MKIYTVDVIDGDGNKWNNHVDRISYRSGWKVIKVIDRGRNKCNNYASRLSNHCRLV